MEKKFNYWIFFTNRKDRNEKFQDFEKISILLGFYLNVFLQLRYGFDTVYRQTVYRHPVYRQPVYRQPVYRQLVYRQPVYRQTVLSTRRLIDRSILST